MKEFADINDLGDNLYYFHKICYEDEFARFCGKLTYENVPCAELDDNIEVVGNIFDNPELIGE